MGTSGKDAPDDGVSLDRGARISNFAYGVSEFDRDASLLGVPRGPPVVILKKKTFRCTGVCSDDVSKLCPDFVG